MQMMNVEGLTRENVASHLQKFRLQLKRENRLDDDGNLISPLKVGILDQTSVHGLFLCVGCVVSQCRLAVLSGQQPRQCDTFTVFQARIGGLQVCKA